MRYSSKRTVTSRLRAEAFRNWRFADLAFLLKVSKLLMNHTIEKRARSRSFGQHGYMDVETGSNWVIPQREVSWGSLVGIIIHQCDQVSGKMIHVYSGKATMADGIPQEGRKTSGRRGWKTKVT